MASTSKNAKKADQKPLLEVKNLKKYFPITKGVFSRLVGHVKAVDDVSFTVYPNETVGMVGESGCGKTTAGRTLLRLIEPTEGQAIFQGKDVFQMDREEMRRTRRDMQIIFQDPYSSLNPRMTIESIIGEAIEFHGIANNEDRRGIVEGLLERVGLQPSYVTRYPHEFSGGQRQRIGIARALALSPKFIVCDEAVSALDVSVQAQVINLLKELQDEYNLSYLFIAHDLSVVKHISDRIAVMYLGQVVEFAACNDLFHAPRHPYTQALLSAIPHPNPRRKHKRVILEGDVPSPISPPPGCRFHTRCPACYKPCNSIAPKTIEIAPGHFVRCHLYDPDHAPTDPTVFDRLPRTVPEDPNLPTSVEHDEELDASPVETEAPENTGESEAAAEATDAPDDVKAPEVEGSDDAEETPADTSEEAGGEADDAEGEDTSKDA